MVTDSDFGWIDIESFTAQVRVEQSVYVVRIDISHRDTVLVMVRDRDNNTHYNDWIACELEMVGAMQTLPYEMQAMYIEAASRFNDYVKAWDNVETIDGL